MPAFLYLIALVIFLAMLVRPTTRDKERIGMFLILMFLAAANGLAICMVNDEVKQTRAEVARLVGVLAEHIRHDAINHGSDSR